MSPMTQTLSPTRQPVKNDSRRLSRDVEHDALSIEATLRRVAQIKDRWDAREKKRREIMGIKRRARLLSLVTKYA